MFPDILKKLRNHHSLSQEELASILGYSRAAISAYELGRNEPSFEDLKKIAAYFNVSIDYLLGQDEQKIKATQKELPLSTEQQELLSATTDLNTEELKKTLEYIEFLKIKQVSPSVLLAARDGGGFDPVEGQAEEKARIIKEHPKSNKKLP